MIVFVNNFNNALSLFRRLHTHTSLCRRRRRRLTRRNVSSLFGLLFDPLTLKNEITTKKKSTTTIIRTITAATSSSLSNNHYYYSRFSNNAVRNPIIATTTTTNNNTSYYCYYYDSHHVHVNANHHHHRGGRRYLHHRQQQPAEVGVAAVNNNNNNNKKKKTILFQSLGCPRNFVDTEVMIGLSINNNFNSEKLDLDLFISQEEEDDIDIDIESHNTNTNNIPDYVVINTCGFLESARQESKNVIENIINKFKLKQHQNKTTKTKLIVTGCMVNIQKDLLLKEYPEIDSILGSGDIDQIVQTIEQLEESKQEESKQQEEDDKNKNKQQEQLILSSKRNNNKSFLEQGDTPRFIGTPGHYAYIKIAEGCKKRCSFCIIPTIKGKLQSKPIQQLKDEFTLLTNDYGASEIILIAQDLGDYGKDFSTNNINDYNNNNKNNNNNNNKSHLEYLLKELLDSTTDENLWLRLLYLYPDEITTGLIDLMENDKRICRYLDMPIQHSHDTILKLMRRGKTNLKQIETTIDLLRTKLSGIHIRTSLMVGFPGETHDKFLHLLDFVKRHQLDNVGVFKYSNENLASSSRLSNHVSEEIKEDRYQQLMEVQYDIVRTKNQHMVNDKTKLEVVVEGLGGIDGQDIVGRYYGQCPDIDGQVILQHHHQQQQQQHAEEVSRRQQQRRRRQQNRRSSSSSSSRTRRNKKKPNEITTHLIPGERYMVEVIGYQDYDLIGKVL